MANWWCATKTQIAKRHDIGKTQVFGKGVHLMNAFFVVGRLISCWSRKFILVCLIHGRIFSRLNVLPIRFERAVADQYQRGF
jgi:hypothetical protein